MSGMSGLFEQRAEKAEAEVVRLRAALQDLIDAAEAIRVLPNAREFARRALLAVPVDPETPRDDPEELRRQLRAALDRTEPLSPEDVAAIEAMIRFAYARLVDPETTPAPCATCGGSGCEEGCGFHGGCEMGYAGPNSHKICPRCKGSGCDG